jgi:hypothetical protein
MFRKLKSGALGFGLVIACALLMAAGVNGIFNSVTSQLGYKITGASAPPSGYALCSSGAGYYDSACAIPGAVTLYYQTVEAGGTAATQEPKLNLIGSGLVTTACVDNGGATRTDCTLTGTLPNVGTAGTYASPTSITTDAQGRVSAITAGTTTDVYATTTLCAPSTSTDSQCSGTISFAGLSLPNQPDGNYQPFVVIANTGSTQGASLVFNINSTLSTTGFNYTISCTFFCGTSIPSPPAYVHVHHN